MTAAPIFNNIPWLASFFSFVPAKRYSFLNSITSRRRSVQNPGQVRLDPRELFFPVLNTGAVQIPSSDDMQTPFSCTQAFSRPLPSLDILKVDTRTDSPSRKAASGAV